MKCLIFVAASCLALAQSVPVNSMSSLMGNKLFFNPNDMSSDIPEEQTTTPFNPAMIGINFRNMKLNFVKDKIMAKAAAEKTTEKTPTDEDYPADYPYNPSPINTEYTKETYTTQYRPYASEVEKRSGNYPTKNGNKKNYPKKYNKLSEESKYSQVNPTQNQYNSEYIPSYGSNLQMYGLPLSYDYNMPTYTQYPSNMYEFVKAYPYNLYSLRNW